MLKKNTKKACSTVPLAHGLSHSVIKSTTLCSISSTVVVFPCITVMLGVLPVVSCANPPENITYDSLKVYV